MYVNISIYILIRYVLCYDKHVMVHSSPLAALLMRKMIILIEMFSHDYNAYEDDGSFDDYDPHDDVYDVNDDYDESAEN